MRAVPARNTRVPVRLRLPEANDDGDDDERERERESSDNRGLLGDVDAISLLLRLEGTSVGELVDRSSPVGVCRTCITRLNVRIWIIMNSLARFNTYDIVHFTKQCPFAGHRSAVLEIRDPEQRDRTSVSFEFLISTDSQQRSRNDRCRHKNKQVAFDSSLVVVATMLPLIAMIYDHNSVVVSLSSRIPRYSRGQGKSRDVATIPARLPKLGSVYSKNPNILEDCIVLVAHPRSDLS